MFLFHLCAPLTLELYHHRTWATMQPESHDNVKRMIVSLRFRHRGDRIVVAIQRVCCNRLENFLWFLSFQIRLKWDCSNW